MKQKKKKYKVIVVFKHLPHWYRNYIIEAKSEKKAENIVRRMFKDKLLKVEAKTKCSL